MSPSAPQWPDAARYRTQGAVCRRERRPDVTTQQSCGIAGDLVALVHQPGADARALLSIGRAGSGSDVAQLRAEGHTRMPFRGDIRTVTVPGCVDGWLALHDAYGRLPLPTVLAHAVAYARDDLVVGGAWVADAVPAKRLLDDVAERPARISAGRVVPLNPPVEPGGTVYLCAADADGLVVSLSQSNAAGFGAHVGLSEVGVLRARRGERPARRQR